MSSQYNHRQIVANKRGHDEGYWHDFDYNRLDYYSREHYQRRKRFVESMKKKLHCMECGGSGSYVEDSIDFGDDCYGSMMFDIEGTCGWCDGTGLMTPYERGTWLRFKREEKRKKNANNR